MLQTLELPIVAKVPENSDNEKSELHKRLDRVSAHYEALHHEEEIRAFWAWRQRMKAGETPNVK
ncbi:MAG: hypothetical protein LBQ50_13065 [Planctomycetaceae bacterium]|jgi:hypothetical protein|nr:hypothetical protein [Planctomycetaceae bacterium]